MFKFLFKFSLKFLLLISRIFAFLMLGNIYTYNRLTAEAPIAQLTFTPVKNQEFNATIKLGDFCTEKDFTIYGDEFRIDARFLKWKAWATLFGADPLYRVERLSGRYADINDQNTKRSVSYQLNPATTFDFSHLFERYNDHLSFIDTDYGSSAYETMNTNSIFTVFRTQSGILIRTNERPAHDVMLTCSQSTSILKSSITKIDRGIASLVRAVKF